MTYIVFHQPPEYHQMSLDEFLFGSDEGTRTYSGYNRKNDTSTRTYNVADVKKYTNIQSIDYIIKALMSFNERYEYLREKDRHELYDEFYIPKKSGGLRKIDSPVPELMIALRELKGIIENECTGSKMVLGGRRNSLALYHTSAFAYIKKRCTIDALKRHQANESRWFAKYDLSDFFGSTTLDYVMKMFSMIFPFSEVIKDQTGCQELRKAIELAFLDGGLPQGTPISPLITNIIMIPVDHWLSNGFRKFKFVGKDGAEQENKCIYTRYADDFLVSSRYGFDFKQAEKYIEDVLREFGAPFSIKAKKTRYGSRAGSNWNLGLMLGCDNKITIGHKKKRQLKAMISSYAMDKKAGKSWDLNDIQIMDGYMSYYRMVEPDGADVTFKYLSKRFNIDILSEIKNDLKGNIKET